MIFLVLSTLHTIVYCIHELNLKSEKPYSQPLSELFEFYFYEAKIEEPSLGFSIEGGLIQGNRRKLNIQNSTIISQSFGHRDTLAILSFDQVYSVDLIEDLESEQDEQLELTYLFTISKIKCQAIENLYYFEVIVHCLTENNEVVLYQNVQEEIKEYNTTIVLNDSAQLKSVRMQLNDWKKYYPIQAIYLQYIYTDFAEVIELNFNDDGSLSYKQIWKQSGQFKELRIVNEQVLALSSNCLYSILGNETWKYETEDSQIITFIDFDYFNSLFVFVFTIDRILVMDTKLNYITENYCVPKHLEKAIMYQNNNYLYMFTESSTIIYDLISYNDLGLHQYFNKSIIGDINAFANENTLVTFNQTDLITYKIVDQFLFNPFPKQSGVLNISLYFLGTYEDTFELEIIIIPPLIEEQVQLNHNHLQQELTLIFSQNITALYSYKPVLRDIQLFLPQPVDFQGGQLNMFIVGNIFYTYFIQFNNADSVWQFQVSLENYVSKIQIVTTYNQEILALLMNDLELIVYQIKPRISVTFCYSINLQSYNLNINNTVVFRNAFLIHNYQGYEYFDIFSDKYYYAGSRGQYDFLSVSYQDSKIILYETEYFKIQIVYHEIFFWDLLNLVYFEPSVDQDFKLFVIPLDQCLFELSTNVQNSNLYYFNNSYKTNNLDQQYRYQIYVEGLKFQSSQLSYSNQHFYIWVESKETQYHYIYVYSCSDEIITEPSHIISIPGPIKKINTFSSTLLKSDVLSYQIDDMNFLQYIPFDIIEIKEIDNKTLEPQVCDELANSSEEEINKAGSTEEQNSTFENKKNNNENNMNNENNEMNNNYNQINKTVQDNQTNQSDYINPQVPPIDILLNISNQINVITIEPKKSYDNYQKPDQFYQILSITLISVFAILAIVFLRLYLKIKKEIQSIRKILESKQRDIIV